MARIVDDGPGVYEETTVRRPGAVAPATTVVDDGSGFGFGVVAGVLIAIAIAVLAVLWGTGSFNRSHTDNNPGSVVTSTSPGGSTNTSGNTGGTGSTGGSTNGSGSGSGGSTTTP